MRKLLSTILTILFGAQIVIGQTNLNQFKDWDKIIIVDAYSGWSHFNNQFQIERSNLSLTPINNPDSVIKKVDPILIENLFNSFTIDKEIVDDPLKIFGKDSLWLITNAELLWSEYSKDKGQSKEIDSIAINNIKDYQRVKNVAWSLQGSYWTDDYPFSQISIIKNQDTLVIYSYGQYPFMMPWIVDGKPIFNSAIPNVIGEILPDSIKSNKQRLLGTNFNYYLVESVYSLYIENEVEFVKATNKYPGRFKTLSKHFEIVDAEMSMMGSIEWGGFIAANCLEIILKDSTISNNVQFSAVFGRRLFLHSTRPIIRKKNKILALLKGNPVFEYCLENETSVGEIHFVNRKSFSNQAKRGFLRDVKTSGQAKSKYKGKFHKAIFFELTEYRDNKRSFSRWIFLQDGTIILWQLKGDYLMNLPDEYSNENGYICKEIDQNEIKTMLFQIDILPEAD